MTDPAAARLRGGQAPSLDARSIEQAARSRCTRYRTSVAIGMHPRKLAEAAFGPDGVRRDISPFAQAIGIAFEQWLLNNDGRALKDAIEFMTGWRPEETENLNYLLDSNRQEEAEQRTAEIVRERLEHGTGPELIFGAGLPLETTGGISHIRPDLLIAKPGWRHFRVGEIKSYLDLDGRTDGSEISTAVRQAAVGVTAMRQSFGPDSAEDEVDLVFRSVWRPNARVRNLDASDEIASILDFLATASNEIDVAEAVIGSSGMLDAESIQHVPHRFEPSCEGACAMYEACRAEAIAADELSLLGPAAETALEGLSGLSRAIELAQGASPETEAEERVAGLLAGAWESSEALESSSGTIPPHP